MDTDRERGVCGDGWTSDWVNDKPSYPLGPLWITLDHRFVYHIAVSFVVSLYHIFRCADAPKQGQKKANNRRLRLSLCPASRLPDFKIDSAAVRDSSSIPKSQTGFVSFSFGLK
ncbi:unnamed protein product [[Candida] boidinii]|uniref:Unnamed protein product n=1 Tax=Candida boidinii TaxID=5477 RepID=A0ACB5TMS4_CANBO|nr:unnamed protein product [[Candida] boidinii]GMF64449.1 unnamed protein product [[Candida] boidinii]